MVATYMALNPHLACTLCITQWVVQFEDVANIIIQLLDSETSKLALKFPLLNISCTIYCCAVYQNSPSFTFLHTARDRGTASQGGFSPQPQTSDEAAGKCVAM